MREHPPHVLARARMRSSLLAVTLTVAGMLLPLADARAYPAQPRAPGALQVLTTGDSMVLWIGDSLSRYFAREPGVNVRMDAFPGSGISKPFMFSWPGRALLQVKRDRPTLTVVFLGASDGFPLTSPSGRRRHCCGEAWRRAYARRARRMMTAYSRAGQAYVYWLLLPQPRPDLRLKRTSLARGRIFRAVNTAVRLAASSMGDTVRLLPLDDVFTPDGRYTDSIVWAGRRVTVRSSDGIHLSERGALIASAFVVARMRYDRLLTGS